MKFLENLIKKPNTFQRTIGLSLKEFEMLAKRLEKHWNFSEQQRKSYKDRKREIGAGHPYKFHSMAHKLVVVLLYYKLYLTQEFLGILVDLDQANISRLLRKMLPLIEKAADPELATYLEEAKKASASITKINDLNEFFKKYPDLKDVSTDATEQPFHRSKNNEEQKKYYSGKKKRHTIKVQLSVSKTGRFLDLSKSYGGSVHDKKIIDGESTISKFPKHTCHRFDLGYQGVRTMNAHSYLVLPIKKPKGKELSSFAKELNRANSSRRIVAEHSISRMKKFRICGNVYRGPIESHNQIFRNVASIWNFRSSTTSKTL